MSMISCSGGQQQSGSSSETASSSSNETASTESSSEKTESASTEKAEEKPAEETPAEDVAEEAGPDMVTIKWMTGNVGNNPPDGPEVWVEVNKLLAEQLPGIQIDITCIPFGEYDQRWQLEAASGANWDLAWFGWMLNLQNEVNNGALRPLNDLLDKYGQNLRNELAEFMFTCNTIDGQVYLIPNNQIAAAPASAFFTPTDLSSKYLDIPAFEAAAKEWADSNLLYPPPSLMDVVEDYATKCQEAGELMLGMDYGYLTGYLGARNMWYNGRVGNYQFAVSSFCKAYDNDSKVYSYADVMEEEVAYYERVKSWLDKGFIRKDFMTYEPLDNEFQYFLEGNGYIFTLHNYDKYQADMQTARHGFDVSAIPVLYSKAPTGTNPTATSECIMSGAANPEQAMQFLNFFHSAAGVEVYNMMVYGLEGKHWDFTDKAGGLIETYGYDGQVTPDNPYGIPKWTIGNTYYVYAPQGTDPEYDKYMCGEFNNTAMSMPLSGFVFDTGEMVAEVAAWNDISKEFEFLIAYPNVRAAIEDRNARLEAAGCLNFAVEMQKQVDAFKASK